MKKRNFKISFEIVVTGCEETLESFKKVIQDEEGIKEGTEWKGIKGTAKITKVAVAEIP